jgi:hypothetical protein
VVDMTVLFFIDFAVKLTDSEMNFFSSLTGEALATVFCLFFFVTPGIFVKFD